MSLANIKVVDVMKMQQERREWAARAEQELSRKSADSHNADIVLAWVILAIAGVIVLGVEQGWW